MTEAHVSRRRVMAVVSTRWKLLASLLHLAAHHGGISTSTMAEDEIDIGAPGDVDMDDGE